MADLQIEVGVKGGDDIARLAREIGKTEKQIELLYNTYKKGQLSSNAFLKGLNQQAVAVKGLGFSYQGSIKVVNQYVAKLKEATAEQQRLSQATMATTKANNRMGVVTQQVGYQVGDFFVQVQSGTSFLVAFGQQATQLVGVLPLIARQLGLTTMAAIGLSSALGIIIPIATAIGAIFLRTASDAENLKEKVVDVKGAFDDLQGVEQSIADVFELPFTNANKALLDYLENLKKVKTEQAQQAFKKEVGGLLGPAGARTEEIRAELGRQVPTGPLELGDLVTGDAVTGEARSRLEAEQAALYKMIDQITSAAAGPADQLAARLLDVRTRLVESGDISGELLKNFDLLVDSSGLRAQLEAEAIARQKAATAAAEARNKAEQEFSREGRAEQEKADNALIGRLQAALDYQVKRREEQDKLQKAYDEEFYTLKQQTELYAREAKYGKDSVEYRNKLAEIELRLYQAKLANLGITGDEFDLLVEMYKTMQEAQANANKPDVKKGRESNLQRLIKQIALEEELIGKTEEQKRLIQALGAEFVKNNPKIVSGLEQRIIKIKEANDAQEAAIAYAKKLDQEVAASIESMSDAWADFVMRGFNDFESFVKSVLNSFKNMLSNMIAMAARNQIMLTLGVGGAGIATGAAGGTVAGSLLSGGGLLAGTGVGTFLAGASGGFQAALGLGGYASAGLFNVGANAAVASAATGASAFASTLGAITAPLLIVAGLFSFFSKKTKELDNGIRGTVKNMENALESFSKIETSRFWGLSKKKSTRTSALGQDNPISQMIFDIQSSVVSMANYIGIATDSLKDFSYEFEVSLKGLSEEAKTQKITEEIEKLGNAFAALLPNVQGLDQLVAIMEERYQLETRLLQAQGDTEALRQRELDSVNEYNRAILQQIFATEDAAKAAERLADAAKAINENDFATLLGYNRARALANLGFNAANDIQPIGATAAPSGSSTISSSMSAAGSEISKLRSEMKEMHKETMFAYSKLIKNGKDTRDTVRSWDVVGLPPERVA